MSWASPDGSAEGIAAAVGTRAGLLGALADGPRTKRDLREELGVARSTVYKGLRELTELDLARETGEVRAHGARGAGPRGTRAVPRAARGLTAARDVLADIPASAGVPAAFAESATVATSERTAPERALDTFDAMVRDAERVRSLSPAAIPRYMADLHEDVLAGEDREIVVERPAAAALRAEYDEFDAAVAAGLDVRVLDESLPFGLTLFDDEGAALTTYEAGGVSGILLSEAPEAVAWAERTYADYRDRAVDA
ncbi:helix-turn-helix transcriptional regulator [Halosegnis marinus]|uniref:helix-turn-helix transcriptional regulator n=1 Tax=Halosegnis marinus TaxID=3034023 RepID=UPI003621A33A